MSVDSVLNLDVVVHNSEPGDSLDEFGDPVPVAAAPETHKGWYEQAQRSEDTADSDQQTERWRLFLRSTAAGRVNGSSRVTIAGADFEIDGPPWTVVHPRTKAVSHVEAYMKRVV